MSDNSQFRQVLRTYNELSAVMGSVRAIVIAAGSALMVLGSRKNAHAATAIGFRILEAMDRCDTMDVPVLMHTTFGNDKTHSIWVHKTGAPHDPVSRSREWQERCLDAECELGRLRVEIAELRAAKEAASE